MGRWDIGDDARVPDPSSDGSSKRSDTSRHDPELRITRCRIALQLDHETTTPKPRPQPDAARRRERETVRDNGRVYHLRGSEVDLLERAGQYRVTFTDDLKHDSGNRRFDDDMRSLKEQELIAGRIVTHMREARWLTS